MSSDLDPIHGDHFYRQLEANEQLGAAFAEEMVSMMPKRQRVLVLEGYAFGLQHLKERIVVALEQHGFRVYVMNLDDLIHAG